MNILHTPEAAARLESTELGRRTLVTSAAWALPVVAVAVAAPMAAASVAGRSAESEPAIVDDEILARCGGELKDNGTYLVYSDKIVVSFDTAPDIYEANVRFADGTSANYGTNYGTAPAQGSTSWAFALPGASYPVWMQVHGFDTHYGEQYCPVPAAALS